MTCACDCCERWRAEVRAMTIIGIRIALVQQRGDLSASEVVAMFEKATSEETRAVIDAAAREVGAP